MSKTAAEEAADLIREALDGLESLTANERVEFDLATRAPAVTPYDIIARQSRDIEALKGVVGELITLLLGQGLPMYMIDTVLPSPLTSEEREAEALALEVR